MHLCFKSLLTIYCMSYLVQRMDYFYDLHIPSFLLAGDTALVITSPKSLQNLLNIVEKYSCKWRLHYNPSKSVFIVFNKSPIRVNPG